MRFSTWLENEWPMPWPVRQGVGDKIRPTDTPPTITSDGSYLLFHGTSLQNAVRICEEKRIKGDDWGLIGVCTTTWAASSFAAMKAKKDNPPAIVGVEIDPEWLKSQKITREVGGSGKDQWHINVSELTKSAIRRIYIYSIRGDADWHDDYPEFKRLMRH